MEYSSGVKKNEATYRSPGGSFNKKVSCKAM